MTTLTLEERERLAYIAGDTERAALLAELIDDGYDAGYADCRATVLGALK